VDVARLKAEFTAQRYKATGRIPLAALATGHVRVLNRVGSALPSLANAVNALPPVRWLIGRLMNLHPRRSLPHFSASLFKLADKPGFLGGIPVPAPDAPRVVLFGDCFTAFNESEIGVAAARALTALGYRVEVADAGCCGRSMISVGMLETAATTIDATLGRLRRFVDDTSVAAVLVVEPSCLSAMTDDWLALKLQTPMDVRARLAGKAMLVEDFIDRRWNDHPRRPSLPVEGTGADAAPILLHAHCHQKALWGADSSARLLRRLFGARVRVLDTGCCGMAGSFGYDRAKFPVSETIAHLPGTGLMPQIQAHPGATVCAPGTSCRHQVRDTTGGTRAALHPVELAARALTPSS
jgi:Fe-S oxidoreductase